LNVILVTFIKIFRARGRVRPGAPLARSNAGETAAFMPPEADWLLEQGWAKAAKGLGLSL
jgi:hypothetical protein